MNSLNERLAKGCPDAFAELYDSTADRIFHYLVVRTGSRDDAADLLQECFVRLYRSRANLSHVESLSAYLFQIARNEAIRWSRMHHRRPLTAEVLFEPAAESMSSPMEIEELTTELLNGLSEEHREVVELKVFSQLTFSAIAEITGQPQGTVATWYRRSLERMREACVREDEQ